MHFVYGFLVKVHLPRLLRATFDVNSGRYKIPDIKHKKAEANYLSEYMHGEEADDPVFLKEVTRQETFRILHTAIDKLPAQSKQIIMLSMEGLSNAEVGEKLGISVNTVKTLKKNAYAVLRQVLSKEYLLLLFVILRDYSA